MYIKEVDYNFAIDLRELESTSQSLLEIELYILYTVQSKENELTAKKTN